MAPASLPLSVWPATARDVFLRTGKSSLLFGVGQDAAIVARTITHG